MIRNITRFTESVLTSQCMVGMLRVQSVFEAEVCILEAQTQSQPLLLLLDFPDGLKARQIKYLGSMIQDLGAVVGLGMARTSSLDQVREAIGAGASYISFDVSALPFEKALEQAQYVTQLAHAQYAFVEMVIGRFHKSTWIGIGKTTFDIEDFARKVQFDVLGIDLESQSRELASGGIQGMYADFISDIARRTEVPLAVHGGLVGASELSGVLQIDLDAKYRSISGVSEQACMQLSSYGVKYFAVERVADSLLDLSYRRSLKSSKKSALITEEQLRKEYQEVMRQFLTYMYKLFANTYELS